MGLFESKYCDICGEKIGLLGNRKLEDGNLCKNCASKLSPWFSERRKSTIADIKQHLAYRETNRTNLNGFHPTKTLGNNTKVYIEEAGKRFVVTRAKDFREANADIILFKQVMDASYEIENHQEEIMDTDKDGKEISFNPPRYENEYEFTVTMRVDSPYFSEVSFEVSDRRPDDEGSTEYKELKNLCGEICATVQGKPFTPEDTTPTTTSSNNTTTTDSNELWECPKCHIANRGKFCVECGTPKPIYKCPKCGWEAEDKNRLPKFCPECGEVLNKIN